jgi:hypothetical protein
MPFAAKGNRPTFGEAQAEKRFAALPIAPARLRPFPHKGVLPLNTRGNYGSKLKPLPLRYRTKRSCGVGRSLQGSSGPKAAIVIEEKSKRAPLPAALFFEGDCSGLAGLLRRFCPPQ